MKFTLYILFVIVLNSCTGKGSDNGITTVSLLNEMADLKRLASLPDDNYRTIQFSSYDRRSTSPADSCWFSNEDGFGNESIPGFEKVLKEPDSAGIGEYLICDVHKPGAIMRLWTAGLNGKIRLFLDDTDNPVYEGGAQDFFWKTTAMLSGDSGKPGYADMFRQFDATYFPVPFSRSCRIEWIGDIREIHFYHVGLRVYDRGTNVRTFSMSDFNEYAEKIEEINNLMKNPEKGKEPATPVIEIPETDLPAFSKKEIFHTTGTKAIEYFSVRISADNIENALRKTILTFCFDDSSVPQIQAPVGDFFGSAPGVNPYNSLPFSVDADGTMICRFIMPFRRSARIDIENNSGEKIGIKGALRTNSFNWEEGKSMHFRARWKIDYGLTASYFDPNSNNVPDVVYLMASGAGRVVGSAAYLYNPSNATTSWGNWWGEGDEKIFVDRDTFPSFFGTGSEDYFNYSWSSSKIFSYPYCGQPRNDGPGNRGYVSNFRWHISDDILFMDKIAFYMELGHHGIVPGFAYGRIVYYYALPGTIDDFKKISIPDIADITYLQWTPVAYLGSAGYKYIQAEKIISESPSVEVEPGKIWAGGSIVMWKPVKDGEKIKFNLSSSSNVENATIGLTLSHNPEGGTVAFEINGKMVNFDRKETVNTFEPFQTILANHFSEPVRLKNGLNEVIIKSMNTGNGKKVGIDFVWLKVP
jgi:hypothetical protein